MQMPLKLTKLIILGIALLLLCSAIFEDVSKDGEISPTWSSMAVIGALITAVSLIR